MAPRIVLVVLGVGIGAVIVGSVFPWGPRYRTMTDHGLLALPRLLLSRAGWPRIGENPVLGIVP
jgi:hypothetical protein